MDLAEAMYVLGGYHDDAAAGQEMMTVPIVVVEEILAAWDTAKLEYAEQERGHAFTKRLRTDDDVLNKLVPTPVYIARAQSVGSKVHRRKIIVVDGWEELEKGAVS